MCCMMTIPTLIVIMALLTEKGNAFATGSALQNVISPTVLRESLGDAVSDMGGIDPESVSSAVQLPDMQLPDISSLNIPDFASIDSSSFQDNPASIAAVGIALLATFGGAVAAMGGSDGSDDSASTQRASPKAPKRRQEKKAAPIKIPYHAAAELAYETWCKEHDEKFNEEGFLVFQELFESQAVAQSRAKKLRRDLQAFKNEAKKPIPPRNIAVVSAEEPAAESSAGFFFADPAVN